MSLVASMRALAAAGATPDMLIALVEAHEAARDDALEKRRAADAARQAKRRSLMPSLDQWYALRSAVFERDNYDCAYCGEKTEDPHCDHIVPVSKGGASSLDNLTTACPACNSSKGATWLEDWLARR